MERRWQLQNAKARFSELVRRAGAEGPQIVTYRGVDSVVVLSAEAYRKIVAPRRSFVRHLLSGPRLDDDIVDEIDRRSPESPRNVGLG